MKQMPCRLGGGSEIREGTCLWLVSRTEGGQWRRLFSWRRKLISHQLKDACFIGFIFLDLFRSSSDFIWNRHLDNECARSVKRKLIMDGDISCYLVSISVSVSIPFIFLFCCRWFVFPNHWMIVSSCCVSVSLGRILRLISSDAMANKWSGAVAANWIGLLDGRCFCSLAGWPFNGSPRAKRRT